MDLININLNSSKFEFFQIIFERTKIEPFRHTAINFHGFPGSGKSLGPHAIAHALGKLIIVASYAQIESKFR